MRKINAWAVDTSVLVDVQVADPTFGVRSGQCLAKYLPDGLVISPITYVELGPGFGGDVELQNLFLKQMGVMTWPHWSEEEMIAAHQLWTAMVRRKRLGQAPKRPVADALIEAFAMQCHGLITRNPQHFRHVPVVVPA